MIKTARLPYAVAMLALATLVAALPTRAEPLPPLEFHPPLTQDMLREDLAFGSRVASQWLLELEAGALFVWVWRVPGDPYPEEVFAADASGVRTTMGVTRRELRDTMMRNVEYYAPFFDLEVDPGWSRRARMFADTLTGIEQTLVAYSLLGLEPDTYLTVDVMSHYIDLLELRHFEGTYVRVTMLFDH